MAKNENKTLKKNSLRYNEYYNMQQTFDLLYKQSQENGKFTHLYDLIIKDENIMLAYRNIKNNSGSYTAGTNGRTIEFWEQVSVQDFINYIKKRLEYYQPMKVRRVEIPKQDGSKRPLGIPNIEDRIIQQCIKQILEPICEAKFYKYSYGFRPNRSTEHAIAYLYKKINREKCYYIVDIDIKGFFDNVNHSKLIKQIWALGIQDKKLISIIKTMLKAEIEGFGIPEKGVPQGGILSPLLANIVLNEFDHWIDKQWQNFPSEYQYTVNSGKYNALRKSKLKEIYIVRYADDFKLMCKKKNHAKRIYKATKQWLKERLDLEVNENKSKITNVKHQPTEFLGFSIIARKKKKKYVIKSEITKKAKKKIYNELKTQIKIIQKSPSITEITKYNQMVAGIQNYYEIATEVSKNMSDINYNLLKCLKNRLKNYESKNAIMTRDYKKRYSGYKGKKIKINNMLIYPLYAVKHRNPMLLQKDINNYTANGRKKIHQSLGCINYSILKHIMENPVKNKSIEYNDNRISKYVAQKGICAISNLPLESNMEQHHIKEVSKGGNDDYNNLLLVRYEIHKLIHATDEKTINEYMKLAVLNKSGLRKLNKYRKAIENEKIEKN